MKLIAWNMSDGTVNIHRYGCSHRPGNKRNGKGHFRQDQVEFGTTDWPTKYDFCHDYWDNGILEEYEYENGAGTFDVWAEMDFAPCTSELPEGGPATPEPASPTGKRLANQSLAVWLVDLVAANADGLTEPEKQKLANWLHHLPTGGAGADRYWPANLTRPSQSDWQK